MLFFHTARAQHESCTSKPRLVISTPMPALCQMICTIQTAIPQLCGFNHMFLLRDLKSNCRQRLSKHCKCSVHGATYT